MPSVSSLVSVVIPTRYRPALLQRAIESVLAQTFTLLEIIVVIDGPDEETRDLLNRIQDKRIRVFQLATNQGGADARNFGIQQAQGEWVALLDDDDEWMPEKIAIQVVAAQKAGKRALVTVPFIVRHEGGVDRVRPVRKPKSSEHYPAYMFDVGCGYQTSTFLCAKEFALSVPFSKGLRGCQDLDWTLRLSQAAGFSVVQAGDSDIPLAIFNSPLKRRGVSNKLSVAFLLDWAKPYRCYMNRLGYSRFLVFVCLEKAARDGTLRSDLFRIVKEWLTMGVITPILVFRFILACGLSSESRRRCKEYCLRLGVV